MEIKEKINISNKDLAAGINEMTPQKKGDIFERLDRMDTVLKQKWFFQTSSRLLMNSDLSESELFELLSTCYELEKRLKTKLKKIS